MTIAGKECFKDGKSRIDEKGEFASKVKAPSLTVIVGEGSSVLESVRSSGCLVSTAIGVAGASVGRGIGTAVGVGSGIGIYTVTVSGVAVGITECAAPLPDEKAMQPKDTATIDNTAIIMILCLVFSMGSSYFFDTIRLNFALLSLRYSSINLLCSRVSA